MGNLEYTVKCSFHIESSVSHTPIDAVARLHCELQSRPRLELQGWCPRTGEGSIAAVRSQYTQRTNRRQISSRDAYVLDDI